ncbi:MAG: metalloprotease TldD [Chloracidobacterium sp.]|uniref:Metalloprotease TldD n=1 Tax=Chloracidobacterium validum TaxID=2821543 RepID=A0ABX8BA12_9BACT|nr:metalloprotease TldD [Chloracidobacterium validum]QUW02886.1 metalloprotease TldD [Chloracidobacterium validum]
MTTDAIAFFLNRYGLTTDDLNTLLGEALADGGDYADLYFEYCRTNSLNLEEHLIKAANRSVAQGVGVRVIVGEKTGYAYTDDISRESIRQAARTAACIARDAAKSASPVAVTARAAAHDLYPPVEPVGEVSIERKIELLRDIDERCYAADRRIQKVQVSLADEWKAVMVATSDGVLTGDMQPLARIGVMCIADQDGDLRAGRAGGGGRRGFGMFTEGELGPEALAREAVRLAILQFDAVDAPAGPMEVVLGHGWPGILLHEAIGHGLEADFNRKKTSAFSDLIGQRVASEACTIVDDGTLPGRRGSLNVDDEGHPTSRTVLIEKGILRGYINDYLNARLLGVPRTGNGRRESYRHIPMPRMTNTYMLAGTEAPEDIVRSVKRGLYAVQFGGGQVDITSGKFVFSASEAYLIEDGRITAPVKDATLIGHGPEALTKVTAVGCDLELDLGVGTCGKDGQSVPVGVGMPTIKISEMTVGGTQR